MNYPTLDKRFADHLHSVGFHEMHMDQMAHDLLKKAFMAGAGSVLTRYRDENKDGYGTQAMGDMGREVEHYDRTAPAIKFPTPPAHAYRIGDNPYDPKSETESANPQAHWGGWRMNPFMFNPFGMGYYGGYGGFPMGYGYGYPMMGGYGYGMPPFWQTSVHMGGSGHDQDHDRDKDWKK